MTSDRQGYYQIMFSQKLQWNSAMSTHSHSKLRKRRMKHKQMTLDLSLIGHTFNEVLLFQRPLGTDQSTRQMNYQRFRALHGQSQRTSSLTWRGFIDPCLCSTDSGISADLLATRGRDMRSRRSWWSRHIVQPLPMDTHRWSVFPWKLSLIILHSANAAAICGRKCPSSWSCILPIRQLYGDYTETIRHAWICVGFPDTRSIRLLIYIYIRILCIDIYIYIYIYGRTPKNQHFWWFWMLYFV